jgi:HSP90 family molecular chaperone
MFIEQALLARRYNTLMEMTMDRLQMIYEGKNYAPVLKEMRELMRDYSAFIGKPIETKVNFEVKKPIQVQHEHTHEHNHTLNPPDAYAGWDNAQDDLANIEEAEFTSEIISALPATDDEDDEDDEDLPELNFDGGDYD